MKYFICMIFYFYLFMFSIMFMYLGLVMISMDLILMIEWEVISINSVMINMLLLVDWMSMFFMMMVLLISSCVVFYSWSYMEGDYNINRFIILVMLFVGSMMLLIISPNLISILLGWDGLGLVSFCLVVYYQNFKSFNSGMLTVLSNRIGDVMILMSIVWMLNYGGFNFIYYLELFKFDEEMKLIGLLIIFAAITKSAQIPFSSWLPAAMAAPTPVSALVHSSTLVTAGIYLLIRFSDLFLNSNLSVLLLLLGTMTMFMSGLSANFEFDLKKIIALSTLSQLGLMMSILAMGFKYMAFFHLLSHAMFKSMLFMCAGFIIHNMKNIQDIRFMGNLIKFMPLICINLNIGNLALCGFPFLAGFYSKELILEMCLMSNLNWLIFFFFFFSTGLTISYSIRLMYFNMFSDMNFYSLFIYNNNDYVMLKSISVMMLFSVLGGSMLMWLLYDFPNLVILLGIYQYMILIVMMMGMLMGYMIYKMNMNNFYLLKLFFFLNNMWFLVNLSTIMINKINLFNSLSLIKFSDYGWLEKLGGQGLFHLMMKFSMMNYLMNMNLIKNYLITMFIWFMMILLYLNN
uniref:NADH-ubiquinone oxidoreductase chain 5 n=1 Tax=Kisaura zhejiangensis (nom. nud.) TaxID=2904921 RepID=A0A9E8LNX6_9NEOP|nr:NADH dehydrogenase subunit 5 [Kisaura zhejiangensis (nom. nud.)]UZZ44072.1 NADH dehydrogenase subunit 5 [Kisaura zhejiangensis (nom. nud.)]